ncbi:MAG: nitrile hydratase subunit beta [Rhodospirillales bacterium]|jgi:hypothetical protein|nr:nitrile hydratase subunit beta [Rhodospirillales bacterium]MDP6774818.1 nitrile hydratase subunit beta [Rhodospirillales bacterium]|tara:strand:+ start:170 stop:487 length:318 start_codon:yes stop_codon:yes gene_type:complete
MRRHHDMGGLVADPVVPSEHDYAPWEKRIDAIMRLTTGDGELFAIDELRRAIEEIGPGAYDEMSYYERWITAMTNLLLEKRVVSVDELGRKMAEIEARWKAEAAQ